MTFEQEPRGPIRGGSSTTAEEPVSRPPLLKWPGGKRALARQILERVPGRFQTYYEPFFGGGAVFFALKPERAVIGDLNEELINCYRIVQSDPIGLISVLKAFKNDEASYYKIREYRPRTPLRRAARLLYLTRLSFNGIHRVNLKGSFNVPYGRKTHLPAFDEQAVLDASTALAGVTIEVGDFETVTAGATYGDVVYFDPPYTVAHANNGFIKYNEKIFSWADQNRLASHARNLHRRGCTVIVSNADHASVRELYHDADVEIIRRYSVISASKEHRRQITECLFVLSEEKTLVR